MTDDYTAQAIQAIRDDATAPLLAHIAELEQQLADANAARDLWEDTAVKLKNNMAARQMGGERWHIVAAELRNLTARVESYERAEGNEP